MALKITYHSADNADHARFDFGLHANVMPPQVGNRIDVPVGGVSNRDAVSQNVFARLLPEGEDCVIAWGVNAIANASNGFPMKDGVEQWVYLKAGERISVIAAA